MSEERNEIDKIMIEFDRWAKDLKEEAFANGEKHPDRQMYYWGLACAFEMVNLRIFEIRYNRGEKQIAQNLEETFKVLTATGHIGGQ